MNRNLLVAVVAIALLIAVGAALLVLQRRTQDDLDDAYGAATQNAADHTQVLGDSYAVATQSAQEAADVQAGLEGDLAAQGTQQGNLEATATQYADAAATAARDLEAALAAQQAAYDAASAHRIEIIATASQSARDAAAVQATQNAAFDTQSTQQADLQASATWNARYAGATQSALNGVIDDQHAALNAQATQQNYWASTATAEAAVAVATESALLHNLATQGAEAATLQGQHTSLAATATQEAALLAAANADAVGMQATIDAQADYITALEMPVAITDDPVAAVTVGDLIFHEAFGDDSLWPTGTVPGSGWLELHDGEYWVIVTEAPAAVEAMALPIINDAYIEMEVMLADCPTDGLFAVSARVADGGEIFVGYYFTITCDLRFWSIDVYQLPGELTNLAFDAFPPLNETPDRRHVIGVWLQGQDLRLYVDGVQLGSATSTLFTSGFVGVYAETAEQPSTVRVDSVRVWRLP